MVRRSPAFLEVVVVAAALGWGGCAQVVEEERVPDRSAPIIGGSVHFGHTAVGALAYPGGGYFCTGTLIAPRVVVTAAHCADGMGSWTEFRTGTESWNPDTAIPIVGYRIPNGWYTSGFDYDIAVAELAYDAPYAPLAHNVNPAYVSVGTNALFIGYGDDGMGGSGIKRSVVMQLDYTRSHSFDYYDTVHNTCYGDSGGPALVTDAAGDDVVIGITSHGDPNCASSGTDTRVDAHAAWIDQQILAIMGAPGGAPPPPPGAGAGAGAAGGTCSTAGVCGAQAPDGCHCDADCVNYGDCCPDACSACGEGCGGAGSGAGAGSAGSSDPCQGVSFAGMCLGDVVVYCFEGILFGVDCGSGGYSCGIETHTGLAICY